MKRFLFMLSLMFSFTLGATTIIRADKIHTDIKGRDHITTYWHNDNAEHEDIEVIRFSNVIAIIDMNNVIVDIYALQGKPKEGETYLYQHYYVYDAIDKNENKCIVRILIKGKDIYNIYVEYDDNIVEYIIKM